MLNFDENFLDSSAWDSFIALYAGYDGGFLQSWVWGEAQRAAGRRVRRLALADGHGIAAGWQVFEHVLPFGQRYWYVPRPVAGNLESGIWNQEFIKKIVELARKERAAFLRVDVGQDLPLERFGFLQVPGAVQPTEELIVDVQPPPEALLAAMKPKTRYNIGLSRRHGVTVGERPLSDEGQRRTFIAMVAQTAKRHGIRPHPEAYYRAMLAVLADAGVGRLLVAEHGGAPLAAALLVSCNGVLTYLHGGSSETSGELMAPHLLHWQAIQLAQRLGCRRYNFGGVSSTDPAWAGLTRFKQGFAPHTPFTRYGGLRERSVRSAWYWGYRFVQKIRNF